MRSQPPPDSEEFLDQPPEGWRGVSPRQFWGMVIVGGVVCILCLSMVPMVLRPSRAAYRTEALSNARQIGLALLEFDQEFGEFPSAGTLKELAKLDPGIHSRGTSSSNDYFAQLIAFGIQSEKIFYCHHPAVNHGLRPDDILTPLNEALKPGECGFSYFTGMSTSMKPDLPVACAPMIPGTDTVGRKPFKGNRAVVLRLDNSVGSLPVRSSDRRIEVAKGRTLLDTGPSTVWGTTLTPDLRHPER